MSPHTALHDPVFRDYVGLVAGLLLFAGLVLAVLQFVFRIKLGNIWKTYQSWLWMAPLAALAIFAGRIPFIVGTTVLALAGFREFARATSLRPDRWVMGASYAAITATGIAAVLQTASGVVLLFGSGLVGLVSLVRRHRASWSLGVLAFVFFGWMWGQLGFLANSPHAYGFLCFLLFATEVNDVAAFTFGKMFGRHLLLPRISPRKTLEGSLGALALSLALPWMMRFSFPFFTAQELVLTGLIVGLGGQVGDLTFSALKRDLGLKDWGGAIPGHGGILDRIDSLIFVAPLFMLMTEYYYPGQ